MLKAKVKKLCLFLHNLVCAHVPWSVFSHLDFVLAFWFFSFGWKPLFMFDRPLLDVPSDSSDTNVLRRQQQRFDPYFVHLAPTFPPSLT